MKKNHYNLYKNLNFEFQEHFMIDKNLLKLTHFEKTGPEDFYSAGKPANWSPFSKLEDGDVFRELNT